MFIGHQAVGFALKRAAPKVSLGWLMLAPLLLDLLMPFFVAAGVEHLRIDPGNTAFTPLDLYDYPITHSLLMAVVWSLALGGFWYWRRRSRMEAGVLAFGVFTHWILDLVTHRPDMPLYPGSPVLVGLGLWNSKVGTVAVELTMFAAALALYVRGTRATSGAGRYGLITFVILLLAIYAGAAFGPPPPNETAVMYAGFGSWLFVPWAAWFDRSRPARMT